MVYFEMSFAMASSNAFDFECGEKATLALTFFRPGRSILRTP